MPHQIGTSNIDASLNLFFPEFYHLRMSNCSFSSVYFFTVAFFFIVAIIIIAVVTIVNFLF